MICCLETADLHSPALRKHGYFFFFPSFFHKGALFSLKTSSGITVNRQTIEIAGAAPLLSGGVCECVCAPGEIAPRGLTSLEMNGGKNSSLIFLCFPSSG